MEKEIKKVQEETKEGSVSAEAITAEMSIKMFENSPLRSFRNFNNMEDEQLEKLMNTLRNALNK
mgnify:FL=1